MSSICNKYLYCPGFSFSFPMKGNQNVAFSLPLPLSASELKEEELS